MEIGSAAVVEEEKILNSVCPSWYLIWNHLTFQGVFDGQGGLPGGGDT